MRKSDLHNTLQKKARDYMRVKSYWINALEMPMPLGVCDVWGLSRSQNYETMLIEVKISKSDFHSRSQRYKENNSENLANRCYILSPTNLIKPEEVHEEWGLLWWNGKRIVNKKQAKFIEITDRQKLEILIHFLSSGINNPLKLLSTN